MSSKEIIIKDESIAIGTKIIAWDKIVGLREYRNGILKYWSHRFPRAEIFLLNGKTISISKQDNIIIQLSISDNYSNKSPYEYALATIRKNAHYINTIFNNWLEWRLILPIIIGEFMIFTYCFLHDYSYESIVTYTILIGILLTPFGWFWEISSRKKSAQHIIESSNKGDSLKLNK